MLDPFSLLLKFLIIIVIAIILISTFEDPNVTIDNIREKSIKRLGQKAMKNNTYMLKYAKKIISVERKNIGHPTEIKDYITAFLFALKEIHIYDDFDTYQKDCIDRLDQMKNIIRNYYQSETDRKAVEIILSCLSIIEVNLLTTSFDHDWKETVDVYIHNYLYIYTNSQFNEKTPKKWIDKIRKNEVQPKEWCDSLLKDLRLMEICINPYQFDKYGRIYFIK